MKKLSKSAIDQIFALSKRINNLTQPKYICILVLVKFLNLWGFRQVPCGDGIVKIYWRYKFTTLLEITGQIKNNDDENKTHQIQKVQVVSYARVNSSKQRHDLQRQLQHLERFVNSQNWHLLISYKDVGSGINDKRKRLLQLIKDLPILQPEFVLCSYYDRLSRFGITLLKTVCSLFLLKI